MRARRSGRLDFWVAVITARKAYIVFARAVLTKSGFCKFIGNFLVPLSPISFGFFFFFLIWQHGKTRFQFDDERFKFTYQKRQYLLTMKTTYFNITGKLACSSPPPPSFFSLLMKLWRSNLPAHKILKHFTEEI